MVLYRNVFSMIIYQYIVDDCICDNHVYVIILKKQTDLCVNMCKLFFVSKS